MCTVLGFVKHKSISVTSFAIKNKGCRSATSASLDRGGRVVNLGTLEIQNQNTVYRKVTKNSTNSNEPKAKDEEKDCTAAEKHSVGSKKFRKNVCNIQMLSESLRSQIFGDRKPDLPDPKLIRETMEKWKSYGLFKSKIKYIDDVSLNLPPLKGKDIEEHFWRIGEEQCKPYRELVKSFITSGLPNPPAVWLCQKGWTKYVEGQEPISVPFPNEDVFVFDVEVCVKLGELPTLATAVSPTAWYGWVCPDLAEGIDSVPTTSYHTNMLIPFEGKSISKEKPRVIIGHNVSFDRSKIKEQYYIKHSALRFLDTMSLHICIGGVKKTQAKKNLILRDEVGKDLVLSTLGKLYNLYCNKELDKNLRNTFVTGSMLDIKDDFQNLMKYCANDVTATYEIFQVVFPVFLKRFVHPVTLAGMLEMGSCFLPVNKNWSKFLTDADQTYDELKSEILSILSKKCDDNCKLLHNEEYKKDLWMWSEDWTTQRLNLVQVRSPLVSNKEQEEKYQKPKIENDKEEEEDEEVNRLKSKFQYLFDLKEYLPKRLPFLPGYPAWYRKLCEKSNSDAAQNIQISTSMFITSKLLNLTWENFPIHHIKEYGWGILVPDLLAENVETSIPFDKLKELTIKNCNVNMKMLELTEGARGRRIEKKASSVPYYNGSAKWCNFVVDNCCYFFKIPHKDGGRKMVKNPLSKDVSQMFFDGILGSSDPDAVKMLDLNSKITYWRNSRQRIIGQMVVWLNKKEACTMKESHETGSTGIIIPKVVVCGTLTRRALESTWLTASKATEDRIGSELRAMIQAPPGYHFVGADVDSQELWIASLIGDYYFAKTHGSTPLGWMTLSGVKSSGTDMHSVTAKAVGISRDHAKVLNYARIYGAGVRFAVTLLRRFNPSMTEEEAREKASKMYGLTKGKKKHKVKDSALSEFSRTFGGSAKFYDTKTAINLAGQLGKRLEDVFDRPHWVDGMESAAFNQLENVAFSSHPVTPFLKCRLSRAVEPRYVGDEIHLTTRRNWVVQSGAVDFLHLMLVCMRWLTNGKARYCFSFHDEVRYMLPTKDRYNGALAMHITNLLVRSFCVHCLGMYDLPQSVAFFSSVEIDKSLRKQADDECVTPSNPHGIEKEYGISPGESLDIYKTIEKSGGSLSPFRIVNKREMSRATKRKHVHREILRGELVPPKENQQIVRVLRSRGNNLHEVEAPESTTYLASMPSKFRKNVWIKRGDYILVEPIKEGGKVKAEIVNILTPDYIKFLKNENIWPTEFSEKTEQDGGSDINEELFVNTNRKTVIDESELLEELDQS